MPSNSVLIKPASGKCNSRCECCCYHDEAAHRVAFDFDTDPLKHWKRL